jgi:hypothetical protein
MYLATPDEIAATMRETSARTGDCTLYERCEWTDADSVQSFETLPAEWQFSLARVQELLHRVGTGAAVPMPVSKIAATAAAPVRVTEPVVRELALSV